MDAKTLDFDEEAQKLFLQLKLDANAKVRKYSKNLSFFVSRHMLSRTRR